MKLTKYLIITAVSFLMLGTACNKTAENQNVAVNKSVTNTTTNTNQTNENQTNANKSEANKTETEKPTSSLATPTDAYKAAYTARQKKDIEGLKKVLSKDALEFFTMMGKDEGKTLDDGLMQLAERPQAATAETRNEKIEGDKATIEYLDETGKWSPMDFVKEGNDWKLTIPKAEPKDTENKNKNN